MAVPNGSDLNSLAKVNILTKCNGFFEQGMAYPAEAYPAVLGFLTCGDSQTAEFNQIQNSHLINLSLPPDSTGSLLYTFTAVIIEP